MNYEFDNNTPIYIQIIEWLENQIISSKFPAGHNLPSVRDLARQFQVNPNTIQRAYRDIEQKGLCYTMRGKGSFVTQDSEKIRTLLEEYVCGEASDFVRSMKKMGLDDGDIKEMITKQLAKGNKDDKSYSGNKEI